VGLSEAEVCQTEARVPVVSFNNAFGWTARSSTMPGVNLPCRANRSAQLRESLAS